MQYAAHGAHPIDALLTVVFFPLCSTACLLGPVPTVTTTKSAGKATKTVSTTILSTKTVTNRRNDEAVTTTTKYLHTRTSVYTVTPTPTTVTATTIVVSTETSFATAYTTLSFSSVSTTTSTSTVRTETTVLITPTAAACSDAYIAANQLAEGPALGNFFWLTTPLTVQGCCLFCFNTPGCFAWSAPRVPGSVSYSCFYQTQKAGSGVPPTSDQCPNGLATQGVTLGTSDPRFSVALGPCAANYPGPG